MVMVRRVSLVMRWLLVWVLMVLACCVIAPSAIQADETEFAQIRQAIQSKGLGWVPKVYDREFALGANLDEVDARPAKERLSGLSLAALPSALDWRDHGGNWVSPIQNQEDCGSCWAFAGVAALESQYALQQDTPGVFPSLSEQILVSCCWGNGGCDGGYMDVTADFLKTDGTYHEACFPYTATNNDCANACLDWRPNAYKIADYELVPRDVVAMKEALQGGPFQVSFYVHSDFSSYGSGVYEYAWGDNRGGHAVLLVGYADTPGQYGGGYFIVKNSWGAAWGESGFFRIGYSQVANAVSFGKTAYRYYMTAVAGDAYEVDDTYTQAKAVVPGVQQMRSIRPKGDVDWATFSLAGESDVVIETSGPVGDDTRMWLYDSAMTALAYDDDSGVGYYSRIAVTLSSGTYYVLVDAYDLNDIIPTYYLDLTAEVECVELATNGGFETNDTWWIPATAYSAGYSTSTVHSGARAMRLGIPEPGDNVHSYSDAQQAITIPSDADQAILSFWLYPMSGDAGDIPQPAPRAYDSVQDMGYLPYDVQYVLVLDRNERWVDTLVWQCSDARVWTYYAFDLSAYAGQMIRLQFGVYNTGVDSITAAFLDDFSLVACGGIEPPTPTPTPTVTPTPLPVSYSQPTVWRRNYGVLAGGWTSQNTYPRALADVDGDTRADVVGFGRKATYVSRSTGSEFTAPAAWLGFFGVAAGGWTSFEQFPRALGDVNGDGQADVVGFGNQATYVSLSNGSGFGAPAAWIRNYGASAGGWFSYDLYPRLVGDVNGDGMADVVGFGNKAVYVSRSDGTSFLPSEVWIANYGAAAGGWTSWDLYPRQLADVDGDGRDDIVGFGNNATYVSLSKGNYFDTPTPWIYGYGANTGGWSSQDVYYRAMGDANGDGMADIIAFGYTDTYVSLSVGNAFLPAQAVLSNYAVASGGWTSWDEYPRQIADVNGDGKADIIGFGRSATYVSLAN